MNKPTKPPVALVTGGSKRIGAAIIRSLHNAGWRVLIHYQHSTKAALQLAQELNKLRANSASTVSADLAAINNYINWFPKAIEHWGQLDLLVNNAAIFSAKTVEKLSEDYVEQLLAVNVKAPMFLAKMAAPYLSTQTGSIINIGDIHGERPLKGHLAYSVSKAALVMLGKSLAKELAPSVRVNTVSPGPCLWPQEENSLDEEQKSGLINRTLTKATTSADEIAQAVIFLSQTNNITGQVVTIDGGRLLAT